MNERAERIKPNFREEPVDSIFYFDLTLGNKCNLKCRICCHMESTAWLKDAVNVLGESKAVAIVRSRMGDIDGLVETIAKTTQPIHLEIKGGEPFMMDEVTSIFETMKAAHVTDRVQSLRLLTNATMFPDHLIDYLNDIEDLEMNLSIDAVGQLFGYARGTRIPFSTVDTVVKRLREALPKAKFNISNTVSIVTLFGQTDLWDWSKVVGIRLHGKLLTRPEYLNICYLPKCIKHLAIVKFDGYHGPNRETILNALKTDPDAQKITAHMRKFVKITSGLDKSRNESVFDNVPELAPIFAEYCVTPGIVGATK